MRTEGKPAAETTAQLEATERGGQAVAEVPHQRIPLDDGRNLRQHTARGVVINAAFLTGQAGLSVAQRFAVAAFLTTAEFGLWGLVLTTLLTLSWFKAVGISDKYIQQEDEDQAIAFQRAFTLEVIYSAIVFGLILVLVPLYALIYGRPEFILPAALLATVLMIQAFHAPIWIAYRQMKYVRMRLLTSVQPVVSTVVMVPMAAAGAGYWSLVVGILAGSFATAIAAVATSPYPLGWRFERGTLREYVIFSWPVLIASGTGLIVVQGVLLVANHSLGLAAVGAISLSASLLVLADRVEQLINRSIYPAICSVQEDSARLMEVFVKANRLGMMWGVPFGVGLFLFAGDLVDLVLGERWQTVGPLLAAMGLVVAARQVGASWSAFFMATSETKPMAINGVFGLAAFAFATLPLMLAFGLDGYIAGAAIGVAVELAVRSFYLRRIFGDLSVWRHAARALAPVIPAVVAVLGARAISGGERTFALALGDFAIYAVVTVAATALLERRLLREVLGYLRPGAAEPEAA